MRDFVILIPGITGSILTVGGKRVFDPTTYKLFVSTLLTGGRNLGVLKQPEPGEAAPEVEATGIYLGPHWLLGMSWVDGYGPLSDRILEEFATTHPGEPGNFHHFPYDWRLDNRIAAGRLRDFVAPRLAWWRDESHNPDARVIFLAHSMGGLVARYYLDVLGAWADCRALVTFGTPYRGSVKALEILSRGIETLGVNLSAVVRSFDSVYQLLPTYPVVEHGDKDYRVAELADLPHIDGDRVRDARQFYEEIWAKVDENRRLSEWASKGYETVPVIGSRQRTLQSAKLNSRGELEFRHEVVPRAVNPDRWDGDGTVPRVSAIPPDLEGKIGLPILAELHGSIQVNATVLNHVFEWLYSIDARDEAPVLGGSNPLAAGRARPGLTVDDLYAAGRPVTLGCALTDPAGGLLAGVLRLTVEPVDGTALHSLDVAVDAGARRDVALDLELGVYRASLAIQGAAGPAASPVHGVFEVLPG